MIINILATDLIETVTKNLGDYSIASYDDIRNADKKMTGFSPETDRANRELKTFLREKLYRHYRVSRMTVKARKVINELFSIFTENPDTLPERYRLLTEKHGIIQTATDYIAGMTDRYALEEHNKLTDPMIKV